MTFAVAILLRMRLWSPAAKLPLSRPIRSGQPSPTPPRGQAHASLVGPRRPGEERGQVVAQGQGRDAQLRVGLHSPWLDELCLGLPQLLLKRLGGRCNVSASAARVHKVLPSSAAIAHLSARRSALTDSARRGPTIFPFM
jgi:hypothetical protein